ncbi:MAG: SlyX family protein [Candidatus Riflebacteria bacterium]|nr:SlyX family protein [Candidatus Riflebacteria bacterium]
MIDENWRSGLEECNFRILELERRNDELFKFVEELNAVVIDQDKRLMTLERQIREMRKQAESSGQDSLSSAVQERPPHY